jgi:hypothetical protein
MAWFRKLSVNRTEAEAASGGIGYPHPFAALIVRHTGVSREDWGSPLFAEKISGALTGVSIHCRTGFTHQHIG